MDDTRCRVTVASFAFIFNIKADKIIRTEQQISLIFTEYQFKSISAGV
jgi:hypothetical protein